MKSKISKKCLSILLSICLAVTMMPSLAFAQEASEPTSEYETASVSADSGRIECRLNPAYSMTQYEVGETVTLCLLLSSDLQKEGLQDIHSFGSQLLYDESVLKLSEIVVKDAWKNSTAKEEQPYVSITRDLENGFKLEAVGEDYTLAEIRFTAKGVGATEVKLNKAELELYEKGEGYEIVSVGCDEGLTIEVSDTKKEYRKNVIFCAPEGTGSFKGETVAYLNDTLAGLFCDPYAEEAFEIPTFEPAAGYFTDPVYKWVDEENERRYTDEELQNIVLPDGPLILTPNFTGYAHEVTDEEGNKTIYTYDNRGRLIQLIDALGNISTGAYNDKDDLISETTPLGYTTRYEYDSEERLVKKIYDDGTSDIYTYDDEGRIASHTKPGGTTEKYEYDEEDRVICTAVYDSEGAFVSATRKSYTKLVGADIEVETDAEGREVTETQIISGNGSVTEITDGNGNVSTYYYNLDNQLIKMVDALGHEVIWEYDEKGNTTLVDYPDQNGSDPQGFESKTTYEYEYYSGEDERVCDNIKTLIKTDGEGNRYISTYDEKGNVVTEQDPNGNITSYTYDKLGNVTKKESPTGIVSEYSYDAMGRLVSVTDAESGELLQGYSYDADGRIASKTAGGVSYSYEYDSKNRHTLTKNAEGSIVEKFTYDAAGNVKSYTDGNGNTTKYTYDAVGNLLTETDPEGNTQENIYNKNGERIGYKDAAGRQVSFEYDGNGNVTAITDKAGIRTEFEYDANNRQIASVTDAKGERLKTSFTYDGMGNMLTVTSPDGSTISSRYDHNNNVVMTKDAEGNVSGRSYDGNGNIVSTTDANGNTTAYFYDSENRLRSVIDAQGNETVYEYDSQGRATCVSTYADGEEISQRIVYDELGRVISEENELAKSTGSENKLTYSYDKLGRVAYKILEDGRTKLSYSYDGNGNVLAETYSGGGERYSYKYEYNKNNQLICVTDPAGGKTSYTYTSTGVVETETNAEGGVTSYAYDDNDNVISVTDPAGNTTRYKYDAQQRLSAQIDPNGNVYTYEYDKVGNLTKSNNPDGGFTSYKYDKKGQVISVSDSQGSIAEYAYDGNGNKVQQIAANGDIVRYEYDSLNRLSLQFDSLKNRTQYTYDSLGRTISLTNALGDVTSYRYDAKGRTIAVIDALGNVQSYTYDAFDRVTAQTDALGNTTKIEYDIRGNIIKQTDALGNVTLNKYDINSKLVSTKDSKGVAYTYMYDAMGRTVSATDPEGASVYYEYDLNGNVTKYISANAGFSTYSYDANGNVICAADAYGNETKVSYDSMNRPTQIDIHREDAINKTDSHELTSYTYDTRGNVLTETNALGNTKKYSYDESGNVIKLTDEQGKSTTYKYDLQNNITSIKYSDGSTTSYNYNALGIMTRMQDKTGVTDFETDKLGRITAVNTPGSNRVEYSYDAAGNIRLVVYPDGNSVSYEYDAANRLKSANDSETGDKYSLSYDANGNISQVQYANGELQKYEYDKAGRTTRIEEYAADGSSLRASTEYSYDSEGNRTQIINKSIDESGKESVKKEQYTYDKLNRMTSSNDGENKTSYIYDSIGNLVLERSNNGDTSYSYNDLNQLISKKTAAGSVKYKYDKAGNRISESSKSGITSYSYDAAGKLVQADTAEGTTVTYQYNGLGMRVASETITNGNAKDTLSKSYVVDFTSSENDDLYVQAKGDEDFTVRYIYAAGEKLAQITHYEANAEEKLLYVHEDIMGSSAYFTEKDGRIYAQAELDPWGNAELSELLLDDDSIEINYTGHPYDKALGIYFAEARFYDPQTKSFMAVDPDKDGNNWYQYCGSNPVNYWDPTGMSWWDELTDSFGVMQDEAEDACDIASEMVNHIASGITAKIQEWKEHPNEAALKLAVGMGTFAITAALAVATGGTSMLITGAILGAAESAIDAYLDEVENGQPTSWKEIGTSALIGGVSGLVMGGAGAVALKAVKPLQFCAKTAGEVTAQIGTRWAAGTAGNYVGGMVTNFASDLIEGKSMSESAQDTWEKRYDILADAAAMSLVNVATEAVVTPKCFTAGTLVLTAEGLVAIETIEVGDRVLAYDEETGEIAYKDVLNTFVNSTDELTYVTMETENGELETIESTPGHPYYVEETGEFVKAYQLEEGTKLSLADGRAAYVKEIQTKETEETVSVYNFEVDDFHTYYVGENSVLVHNMRCEVFRQAVDNYSQQTLRRFNPNNNNGIAVNVDYESLKPPVDGLDIPDGGAILQRFGNVINTIANDYNTYCGDNVRNISVVDNRGYSPYETVYHTADNGGTIAISKNYIMSRARYQDIEQVYGVDPNGLHGFTAAITDEVAAAHRAFGEMIFDKNGVIQEQTTHIYRAKKLVTEQTAEGNAFGISRYSQVNPREFFAENFVAYRTNRSTDSMLYMIFDINRGKNIDTISGLSPNLIREYVRQIFDNIKIS